MARQNIQFKGIRHSPSDITGQDGDLLECVNLIHENGELKPIEMPEKTKMRGFWSNETLVAVHNLTDGKKFVFAVWNGVTTTIHIKNEDGDVVFTMGIPQEEIAWAETVGNTLIIGTDKSTYYALYKNGAYKWLGDKLPQPVFEFDLNSNTEEGSEGFINAYEPNPPCEYYNNNEYETVPGGGLPIVIGYSPYYGYYYVDVSDVNKTLNNKRIFRENLLAKVASLTNISKKRGKFIYPFFVRYAVRMFDGNYAMHSAPILMLPSTDVCPILAKIGSIQALGVNFQGNLVIQTKAKSLKYKFKGFVDENGNPVNADEWEDIIKGVDLFLSSQIVSFDESYYDELNNIFPNFWYYHDGDSYIGGTYDDTKLPEYGNAYTFENQKESWLQNHKSNRSIDEHTGSSTPVLLDCIIPLHSKSKSYIKERIEEEHLFYRVKKYDLDELDTTRWDDVRFFHDETEGGLLERLETLPILPDDYVSRSRMAGKVNYNYNQRLILGNIKLQEPKWYQDAKLFQKNAIYDLYVCFVIEKPEKTIYIRYDKPIENDWGLGKNDFGHYLYYPDLDCKKAIVRLKVSSPGSMVEVFRTFEVPMHEHSNLHGVYALMPDLESLNEACQAGAFTATDNLPLESSDRYYQLANTIAMSGVADPFYFPASNFKDIGRTKVVGIASNTLDVSSGQWGQYPLYVFCSDGIIAVIIDGEGKFGGIQAVSADVLREPRGLSRPTLVQTGQALMFLTQRGVMAIAGTQINCLSDALDGRNFRPMTDLQPANSVLYLGAFGSFIEKTGENFAFRDYASGGFLAYDYAHHRVLLLRSDREYHYVYNMKTGMWSKGIIYTNLSTLQMGQVPGNQPDRDEPVRVIESKIINGAVNNYTEMYLQDKDGWLYKTMEVQGENSSKQLYQYGYLISRPVRFGTDEYKTLTRVLHRYTHFAQNSFVRMALYGSRDGEHYGRVNTLRGMSYQYFIFVVYTYLKPNERYSYLSAEFEVRLGNKLR